MSPGAVLIVLDLGLRAWGLPCTWPADPAHLTLPPPAPPPQLLYMSVMTNNFTGTIPESWKESGIFTLVGAKSGPGQANGGGGGGGGGGAMPDRLF